MSTRNLLILAVSSLSFAACTSEGSNEPAGSNQNAPANQNTPATTSQPSGEKKTGQAVRDVEREGQMYKVGGPGVSDGERLAVAKVLEDPAEYTDETIRVTGPITSVCPKKGCWARIGTEDENMMVRFDPYEIQLPTDATGELVLEGTVQIKEMSVDELRHYAEDAGKSEEEIAKITEPETTATFLATAYELPMPKN